MWVAYIHVYIYTYECGLKGKIKTNICGKLQSQLLLPLPCAWHSLYSNQVGKMLFRLQYSPLPPTNSDSLFPPQLHRRDLVS